MLSSAIYLKTKLDLVKRIVIHELFRKTIKHYTLIYMFKHYGKKLGEQKLVGSFQHFLYQPFESWNNFCDFKFFRKDSLTRCLKIFQENELYRFVDIRNNITVKTTTTNDLLSFECLEYFFKFLKRKFFMLHQSITLR